MRTSLRFVRQYQRGRFDPALYRVEVAARDDLVEWSASLTRRLAWRTVGLLGFAESRALPGAGAGPPRRQLFFKLACEVRR